MVSFRKKNKLNFLWSSDLLELVLKNQKQKQMEITIKEFVKKTVEVPTYFKKNNRFCKLINSTHYLSVNPTEFDPNLLFTPEIQVNPISCIMDSKFEPISKAEFDLEFLKAETILNELRNK